MLGYQYLETSLICNKITSKFFYLQIFEGSYTETVGELHRKWKHEVLESFDKTVFLAKESDINVAKQDLIDDIEKLYARVRQTNNLKRVGISAQC